MMRAWKIICLTLLLIPVGVCLALASAPEDPLPLPGLPAPPESLSMPELPAPPQVPPEPEQPPPPPPKQPDAPKVENKQPDAQKDVKSPPVQQGFDLIDPTVPSKKLQDVLNTTKAGGPASLPNVALRGRIITRDRPPAAILELGGKLFVVSKGSVVAGPGNITLRIEDINSQEVRIDVEPRKETLTLR